MALLTHEEAARARKVAKLVETTITLCGTPDKALAMVQEHMDDRAWRGLAIQAQCNPPSDATRELVVTALRVRVEYVAPADPFVGLT